MYIFVYLCVIYSKTKCAMKKILVLSTLILSLIFLFSCSGNGSGSQVRVQSARLKSASISGAKALAVAHKTGSKAFTKADDSAADALYKVSSDGKFIEVTYTFDIEVEEGEGEATGCGLPIATTTSPATPRLKKAQLRSISLRSGTSSTRPTTTATELNI